MSDLLLVAEQHVHIHTCRQVVHTYKLLQRVSSIFFFDQTIRHLNREEGKKEQKRSRGGLLAMHRQARNVTRSPVLQLLSRSSGLAPCMQPRICTVLATPPTQSAAGWPAANRRPAPCTMEPLITPPEPFGGTSLALATHPCACERASTCTLLELRRENCFNRARSSHGCSAPGQRQLWMIGDC